jgi:restriction endonuclease Mrr
MVGMVKSFFGVIVAFKGLFYFFGIVLVFALVVNLLPEIPVFIVDYFRRKRYEKWLATQKTLNDLIYKLRPEEFEDYIGTLLKKLGYEKVEVVGGIHQADGGFDVRAEKNNQTYYIQVKKYGLRHPVRVEQVRAFYGALKADHPEARGIFITTSFFTYGFRYTSEQFAKKVGVELIDGKKLVEMIAAANNSNRKIVDRRH